MPNWPGLWQCDCEKKEPDNETRETEGKGIQESGLCFPGKQLIKYEGGWRAREPHALPSPLPLVLFFGLAISKAPERFDSFTWQKIIGRIDKIFKVGNYGHSHVLVSCQVLTMKRDLRAEGNMGLRDLVFFAWPIPCYQQCNCYHFYFNLIRVNYKVPPEVWPEYVHLLLT